VSHRGAITPFNQPWHPSYDYARFQVDRDEKEIFDPTKIGELEMPKINDRGICGSMVMLCQRLLELLETVRWMSEIPLTSVV
jgi:hypothetical protein